MRLLAALTTTLALAVAGLGITAVSAVAKPCGSIRAHGQYYSVGGGGVSCHYMRKWSKRMARHGNKPKRGWDKCEVRSDGGGCQRGPSSNRDFFIYYPVD